MHCSTPMPIGSCRQSPISSTTRSRTAPVRSCCSPSSATTSVELHVSDSGDGFDEAFLPRAFDRFSRADEARGRGGTGLGLSIVELIARAHGGRAGAANRPEGGADVWLAVPRPPVREVVRESLSRSPVP